jgi:hypothetical protein
MKEEKNILDSAAYKKNPFLMPDNYFSDFSKNLENRIHIDSPKKVSLFVKMKPWMYIAASFLIFMGCLQWYISGMVNIEKNSVENIEEAESSSAEAAMLYAYFDDLMIMDYLASDNE